jgi:L-ascorbate metabolism protein UlaG (beta-lactamase superfamily)
VFESRRVKRAIDAAGGRSWPPNFVDRLTSPLPSSREVWRMMREGPPRRQLMVDAHRIPVSPSTTLLKVGRGQVGITWVGHATYVIQIGGLIVVTDPVWSPRIPGVQRRLTPAGLPIAALPRVDAIVISHNHYDHLDAPSIRQFPRQTPILVPANLGPWFRHRGYRNVIELDWYESHRIGGVDLDFVPAHHWSRRGLVDTCRSLWGGWMLTDESGQRVFFAGDTGYGHFFGEIAARYPGIDLALMPVGAYEPNWFMQPVHLNPAEAVRACGDLGAPRMATMHWGTFILSTEPLMAPVEEAERSWAGAGRPRDCLWDLAVGETRVL